MRTRTALDLNTIPDDDVRQAATKLVELQSALAEISDDPKSAELQSLLARLQESQQQLTSSVQQLTTQQTTAVNSVIGYQTAMQRTDAAPRYKSAFIRPLVEFVNSLSRAYQILASKRAASIAKHLVAEQGIAQDEYANIKQKIQETSGRAAALVAIVKRNEELIKQLNDVMSALGVADLLAPPQAPTGIVVPEPVPSQQPATIAPEEPQAEA
jgi:DNA repair exonuclease SbcCD ATPase subunit